MKERTSRKLAYLTNVGAAVLAVTIGIVLFYNHSQSGDESSSQQDEMMADAAAPSEGEEEALLLATAIEEGTFELGEIERQITEKSVRLQELEDLIEIRSVELERIEVLLAEKGIELQEVVAALRTGDYDQLSALDDKMQAFTDPSTDPVEASLQTGLPNADSGAADFSVDIRKIGEIIQKARIEANPVANSETDRLLVEIHFEVGSSDLTIGGQTRAMVAAETVSEMKLQAIRIEAHSDTTGPAEVNARLSEARANSVARIFAEAGIPESAIQVVAVGEDPGRLPVATPDGTPEPLNRTVAVYPVALTN